MREFYDSAYGPVAREMEAFFASYARRSTRTGPSATATSTPRGSPTRTCIGAWGRLLPPAAVEEAERHLREAEKKAPPGEYADRVRFHRFGQDYTRVMLDLLDDLPRTRRARREARFLFRGREGAARRPRGARRACATPTSWARNASACCSRTATGPGPTRGSTRFTNDAKLRQWHAAVKAALGIEKPSAVTKADAGEIAGATSLFSSSAASCASSRRSPRAASRSSSPSIWRRP